MWRLIIALALCAGTAWAQPQTLSREEARRAASQATLAGSPEIALEIAQTLIQVDPNDTAALIIASQAARASGDNRGALGYAQRAWDTAEGQRERFQAALVTAQALASDGKRTRAQLWLRRAAQIAPTEQERANAIRDFRYVRGRNPWRTTLRFGVQPSSNINNGSKNDTFAVGILDFTLSGDARALSGIEYRLGATTTFQRPIAPRTALRFGARFDALRYELSQDARDQAPNADASDYAFTEAELFVGLRHAPNPTRGAFDAELTLGQNWYGADLLSDYAELQFSHSLRLAERSSGFAAVRFSWADRKDNPARSSRGGEIKLGWSKRFENRDRLTLTLSREVVQANSDLAAYSGTKVTAAYALAQPILGASATFSAGFEQRDYKSGVFGLPREDHRTQAALSLFFPNRNLYGFAPTLDLTWDNTDSTSDLYETERFGLRFGLRSAF